MTVIVLLAAPEGLRGHLTRWMVEVSAGVFVGDLSERVRNRLWPLLADHIGDGQAVMVEPAAKRTGLGSPDSRPRTLAPRRLRRTDSLRPPPPLNPQFNKPRPRTRGDGPLVGGHLPRPTHLVPAHAGMARGAGARCSGPRGSSPHAREWSFSGCGLSAGFDFVPVSAGIVRSGDAVHATRQLVPATQG